MTLLLDNDDVAAVLDVRECIDRLHESFLELAGERAISRPRSDIFGPSTDEGRYVFKTMDGLLPAREVAALRLNSDVIRWRPTAEGVRKEKHRAAPGGRYVGLVLLFSTRTGEPLAIMPDGVMQRLRVAGTNAIAARAMARRDASTYALLGTGWQAHAQAWAMCAVRPIEHIRVYSPTVENRERVAAELRTELGIDVKAVGSAMEAVDGADIVGCATNSITPVVEAEWLGQGSHVTCVKELELAPRILEDAARIVVHTRQDRPANYVIGRGEAPIYAHDPAEGVQQDASVIRSAGERARVDLTQQPDLAELVSDRLGKPDREGRTVFVNTIGTGLQFAAVAALAHERARERGLGQELPTEWFLEDVHP
jgi:ornithine cyclodeaminase/alanine dehydrogenase-like protein (mu-crystallin family)